MRRRRVRAFGEVEVRAEAAGAIGEGHDRAAVEDPARGAAALVPREPRPHLRRERRRAPPRRAGGRTASRRAGSPLGWFGGQGRLPAEPRRRAVPRGLELQRSLAAAVLAGRDPRHGGPPRAPARRSRSAAAPRRASCTCPRAPRSRSSRPTAAGGRPTTARAARLLPDPRPEPARAGRQEVLPRPRGGDHRARSRRSGSRRSDRGPDRRLAARRRRGRSPRSASTSAWVTTHGYALNVDLDPAPFTEWITACGLEDAAFTSMARELGRPVTRRRGAAARRRRARRGRSGSRSRSSPATTAAALWPQTIA